MADDSITDGILAEPPQPGALRVCTKCRAWFALQLETKRDDKLLGSIATYRCKKCDAKFEFGEHHPPGAI